VHARFLILASFFSKFALQESKLRRTHALKGTGSRDGVQIFLNFFLGVAGFLVKSLFNILKYNFETHESIC
jgi:hypothetical protein